MKFKHKWIATAIAGTLTVTTGGLASRTASADERYPYGKLAPLPAEEPETVEPTFSADEFSNLTFDEIFAKPYPIDQADAGAGAEEATAAPAPTPEPRTTDSLDSAIVFRDSPSDSPSRYQRSNAAEIRFARARRAARAREARIEQYRWMGFHPLRAEYHGNFSSARPYGQIDLYVPVYVSP